jgi:hypothetical protein
MKYKERICNGGDCADVCPVYKLGSRCIAPVNLLELFRSGAIEGFSAPARPVVG